MADTARKVFLALVVGAGIVTIAIWAQQGTQHDTVNTLGELSLNGIENINLRTADLMVTVEPSPNDLVTAKEITNGTTAITCEINRDDVTLDLNCSGAHPFAETEGINKPARLLLSIPQPYHGTMVWEFVSGIGEATTLNTDELEIEVKGGALNVASAETNSADLIIQAGLLRIDRLHSPETELSVNSGEAFLHLNDGNLELLLGSGKTSVQFDGFSGQVMGDVTAGELDLILPPTAAFSFAFEATIDTLDFRFPDATITTNSESMEVQQILEGKVGTPGDQRISLAIRSGNVIVRQQSTK